MGTIAYALLDFPIPEAMSGPWQLTPADRRRISEKVVQEFDREMACRDEEQFYQELSDVLRIPGRPGILERNHAWRERGMSSHDSRSDPEGNSECGAQVRRGCMECLGEIESKYRKPIEDGFVARHHDRS